MTLRARQAREQVDGDVRRLGDRRLARVEDRGDRARSGRSAPTCDLVVVGAVRRWATARACAVSSTPVSKPIENVWSGSGCSRDMSATMTRGVEPAGEEGTQGHVGDHAQAHGVVEQRLAAPRPSDSALAGSRPRPSKV